MADTWTLITPAGAYQLNPTFSAPQYEPGSSAGPGLTRHPNTNTLQREGDGLRTPGPLTLTGRVWRDDQDAALILSELDAIRQAVAACTSVQRANTAGTYTYDGISGGPPPEITPDNLGGWAVKLDLWPAKPEATFLSLGPALVGGWAQGFGSATDTVNVPAPLGWLPGDVLTVFTLGGGQINAHRLRPTNPEKWHTILSPTANAYGALTIQARELTLGDPSMFEFTSLATSNKLVLTALVRNVQILGVEAAASSVQITSEYTTPSITPTHEAALLAAFTAQDSTGSVGEPFSTPGTMLLASDANTPHAKGLLAFERVPAGKTGTRASSQAPSAARGYSSSVALPQRLP